MSKTIFTIEEVDLSALTQELKNIQRRLDAVEMRPLPQYVPIHEYAALIGRSVDTVKRRLPTLDSKIEAGVVMIRNPNLGA